MKRIDWFNVLIVITVVILFIGITSVFYSSDKEEKRIMVEHQKILPIGTEVIVKGTKIQGTITKYWYNNNIGISLVDTNGYVHTLTFDFYLLKKTE